MRPCMLALALAILTPVMTQAAGLAITIPANDTTVVTSTLTVRGTATPSSGTVTLRVGQRSFTTTVAQSAWSVAGVPLSPGLNKLEASFQGLSRVSYVTRATSISRQPQQKVRFVWGEGTDSALRDIARGTINAQLSTAQLDAFVIGVRTQTEQIFSRAFAGIADVVRVDMGDDVHTVQVLSIASSGFGVSPIDCGSDIVKQTSRVFLGTYRRSMVERFGIWDPMLKTDPLQTRIDDVANALGRTAAHEAGHSLGFVASSGNCSWMHGCRGSHNCPTFERPGIDRFNSGFFIMDPGELTDYNARIAEPRTNGRSIRTPAAFNAFNRSYLGIVHPLP
jgi:hypothetical protein